ncbi:MAG: LytTR family transcriptional regulator [Ramlibacter sp.]|nr:LytTR family transcriptional regulator [Ramlibacter sp.]
MTDSVTIWLRRYQPYRRRAEVAFWVVVLGLNAAFNSAVAWMDLRRSRPDVQAWEPVLWEVSSVLVLGLMVPALIAFERRYPLRWERLPRHLGAHLVASVVFCAAHMALMFALRYPVYALVGATYRPGPWLTQFGYEYLKDVRSYATLLLTVLGYRLLLLRAQGEARVLDPAEAPAGEAPAPPTPTVATRPERFLVRKLRKEFLVAAADIEWLQAQGNYVALHVHGHDYLLRSTLSDFMAQLDPARFARVHRSHVVNLDRIAEIEPTDGGDAVLRMKDGSTVPCSRRYRDALAGPAPG